MANVTLRRRALFQTPVPVPPERCSDNVVSLTNKIDIEEEIMSGLKCLQKGLHEQRLKKLRKKLELLPQDDWKYPTVESLIGLK